MNVGQRFQRTIGIGKWLIRSPKPDDHGDGPFAVFDYEGKPAGFYPTYEEAVTQVQDNLNQSGTVYDLRTRTNVSPHRRWQERFSHFFSPHPLVQLPKLNQTKSQQETSSDGKPWGGEAPLPGRMDGETEELVEMLATMNTSAWSAVLLKPDLDLVPQFIAELNAMHNIPVIDYYNLENPDLTREVTIQEPVVVERTRSVVHNEPVPITTTASSWEPAAYPTNDQELRQIEGFSELDEIPLALLGTPTEFWAPQVAERELLVSEYQERIETPVASTVERPVTRQEPYQKTVTHSRKIRVPDATKGQNLIILMDWSPSTLSNMQAGCDNRRICMEIALASVVIGCHMKDGSRYLYRPFTGQVGALQEAPDEVGKARLIAALMVPPNLGGGTDIQSAITTGADDIRRLPHRKGDTPEILLLTDGQGAEDAGLISLALHGGVLLHTVCVNASNPSLRACSKTYMEMWTDANNHLILRR